MTRFNLLLLAVRVRTSTDRTGCTNFFRKKMHFLRTGVDKRLDAHESPHPAATGQGGVMRCTRVPSVGTLVFFASCLNIRKILQERRKAAELQRKKKKALTGCRFATARAEGKPYIEQNGRAYYNEEKAQKGGPTTWHRNICPHRPTSVLRT